MRYIDSDRELRALVDEFFGRPVIAVDTEAAGYHRYLDRVCLVQLTADEDTAIIDALAVDSLQPLSSLLSDPETEIVFHDADYDLRLLDRDHKLRVARLFDTKVAAQFLGDRQIGLSNLLDEQLGVLVEKKYQRADWARRPLPQEMLEYAAEDTRHLPNLRRRLCARLEEAGRLEWALEEFELVRRTRHEENGAVPAFLRLKGARDFTPRQLAVLREVHDWREEEGRRRDRATFRVMSREALMEIARAGPRDGSSLGAIKGVSPRLAGSPAGRALMEAVRRGQATSDLPSPPPRGKRRARPTASEDARAERIRVVRDEAAERLDLERGFLLPKWLIERIASAAPLDREELLRVPDVRRWQVDALG
ncbi:MAG: HRDC domain-containing protein, partial [Gemmatimonadota bacterium]